MGWRQIAVVSPLVIITAGSGVNSGLFVYNGQPGVGNLVFWVVAPGTTSDPFGNTVQAVMGVGTLGGPGLEIDQFGNLAMAGADGSLLELSPEANLPFSITSVFSGIMQTLITERTLDSNETQAGIISGIVLGTGTTAKMGTLITSPYAAEGMGLLLQAQNDGATDVPWFTVGTVTTQGGTVTFTPIFALGPQVMLLYAAASGSVVIVTHTSGSGTIPIPVGVTTAKGEAWGPGGNGGSGPAGGGGGGGGGSGSYGAEPALVVPSGGTVAYSCPAGNSGSPATLTGSSVTVTGNAGSAGSAGSGGLGGASGAGAAASANTVAFAGARGGAGGRGGGGGSGSSGGPGGAGNVGHVGSPTLGGLGGAAVSGGGAGQAGGNPGGPGVTGGAPGAGGSGGGSGGTFFGNGAGSQVRLTYSTGTPGILASFAAAAGSDQFGTTYKAGTILPGPADGQQYNAGPNVVVLAATATITTTTAQTILSHAVGVGTYDIEVWLVTQNATVNDPATWAFTGPAAAAAPQLIDWQFTPTGASQSVNYAASGTYTSGANGAGPVGNQRVHIMATVQFTAAGTLALTGKQSVAGNNITVSAGSRMRIQPVVAA